jgi:hypothetical protein
LEDEEILKQFDELMKEFLNSYVMCRCSNKVGIKGDGDKLFLYDLRLWEESKEGIKPSDFYSRLKRIFMLSKKGEYYHLNNHFLKRVYSYLKLREKVLSLIKRCMEK